MDERTNWSLDQWAGEIDALLDRTQSHGCAPEERLYLGYDIHVRTEESARALAADLRAAGYVVEFVDEDRDYWRWTVVLSDPNAVVVTPEVASERWRKLVPMAQRHEGALVGFSVGPEIRYGDQARSTEES